jgi:hypothetical protein
VLRWPAKTAVWMIALAAVIATAGCQPSVTSQLEAGLPQTASRPTTTPNEVGRDADQAGTQLLDSHVTVSIAIPARSIPASRTPKGGHILATQVNPTVVDLNQSNRRYVGFKVVSQQPAAGAALVASQAVVLILGAHPRTSAGATWYWTHPADVKRDGELSCYDSTAGGATGCHVPSYCDACHFKIVRP